MSESLRALLRVQELDGEIRSVREALTGLERQGALGRTARQAEESAVVAARAPLEDSERQHRQLEAELADLESKLTRLETQLYEVSSKQAFEGLQREIDQARAARSELEDRILERLERIDGDRDRLRDAEHAREEGVHAGALATANQRTREGELASELARLEALRAEITGRIGSRELRHYDRIRERKWPAALLLKGTSCPGCRIVIPPQTLNDIRRGEDITSCLGCGRILYDARVLADPGCDAP